MDFNKILMGVLVAASGVLAAGLLMSSLRGSVDLIATAHKGFDS